MPTPSSLPVLLPLTLSPLLRGAFVVAHLIPFLLLVLLPVPAIALWLSIGLLLMSLAWHVRAWRAQRGGYLSLTSASQTLLDEQGRSEAICILPSSVDFGWLIVLHWRTSADGKLSRWAWTREAHTPQDWRCLRLLVRGWSRQAPD